MYPNGRPLEEDEEVSQHPVALDIKVYLSFHCYPLCNKHQVSNIYTLHTRKAYRKNTIHVAQKEELHLLHL
jgi:hypothetical protein